MISPYLGIKMLVLFIIGAFAALGAMLSPRNRFFFQLVIWIVIVLIFLIILPLSTVSP